MRQERRRGLDRPLYSYHEADHLARLTSGTARRWLTGYRYADTHGGLVVQPPVTPLPGRAVDEGVSFLNLVELVAIGGLKGIGFGLPAIRKIVANCQTILQVERPLAALKFKTDGREIFVARDGALVEVLGKRGRQAWDEVLEPFLHTLDYEDDLALATRWWPLGKGAPIVVDPDYGYGLPVIQSSGVRTEIILERFRAGDLEEDIAGDFNVRTVDVQRALQFELSRLSPAA